MPDWSLHRCSVSCRLLGGPQDWPTGAQQHGVIPECPSHDGRQQGPQHQGRMVAGSRVRCVSGQADKRAVYLRQGHSCRDSLSYVCHLC